MKNLLIPKISSEDVLETEGVEVDVAHQPWQEYFVSPDSVICKAILGYTGMNLHLKFHVKENEVRAVHKKINDMVCEDSCVECFISDREYISYANFEFNPRGACMAGIGTDRHERRLFPVSTVEKIKTQSSFSEETDPDVTKEWYLKVSIPLSEFDLFPGCEDLGGLEVKGNLYKCGDKLKFPHYLTWNPSGYPIADFHQISWFGMFIFSN